MTPVSTDNVLAFNGLTVGQAIVLVHVDHATHDEMLNAHTGTIAAINEPEGTITFNFPNKVEEPVATMSLGAFKFSDLLGTRNKTFYLVEANVGNTIDPFDVQPPRRHLLWHQPVKTD